MMVYCETIACNDVGIAWLEVLLFDLNLLHICMVYVSTKMYSHIDCDIYIYIEGIQ